MISVMAFRALPYELADFGKTTGGNINKYLVYEYIYFP